MQAASERSVSTLPAEEAELWAAFAGARQASEFCTAWLSLQCRSINGTVAGLLLLEEESGRYRTAASWPDDIKDVTSLGKAAEQALKERRGVIFNEAGAADERRSTQVAYPIDVGGHLHGVAVLAVSAGSAADLQAVLRRLHWGMGWLETLFRRRQSEESKALAARSTFALEMLAGASEHRRLDAAAVTLVNELATRLSCHRVSLGLVKGNGVRLEAISHSAVFDQKTHTVATIENAMEEALDQRAAVVIPEVDEGRGQISLAHRDLARLGDSHSLMSVVLSSAGRDVAVLTLERNKGDAFDRRSVELMEAVAALLGPLFELKVDARRLVAGRVVEQSRSALEALLGPGRLAVKLGTGLALAGLATLFVVHGDFRIASKAVVEGAIQRAAVAPFDGYVATAPIRAGAQVEQGQVLATLDDRELSLEAIRWRSEYAQQTVKYDDALGKRDRPAARIAQAVREEAQAQLALVEDKLARARITAPFRGIVVSGDLSQMIGSPVERGKVLFELAPLDAFRVVLQVDERDIALVKVGQSGQLVLTGLSNASFPLTVTTVTQVATSSDNRTYFRAEASVEDPERRLRPGMEGVGKVVIDRRPLIAAWTRSTVDWIRMTIWKWWP